MSHDELFYSIADFLRAKYDSDEHAEVLTRAAQWLIDDSPADVVDLTAVVTQNLQRETRIEHDRIAINKLAKQALALVPADCPVEVRQALQVLAAI
jgi:hypothetical protein